MNINFDLNYWGGKTYRVRLEESLYDIDLIVIYNRYGDEFMRIRTKDGQYFEYGYYNDRKHFTDEDSTYDIKPISFCKDDEHSTLSNKIFWKFHSDRGFGYSKHNGIWDDIGIGPEKYEDTKWATHLLIEFCNYLQDCYRQKIFYNAEDYKPKLIRFIGVNGIDEKYIKELDKVKFTSKREGIDGYCGKHKYNKDETIICDSVVFCYYKGKIRSDKSITKRTIGYDEWGCESYEINCKQFR